MKGCKVIKATIKGLTVFSFILVLAASLFVAATYVLPSFAQAQPSAVESGPAHTSTVIVTPGILAPSTGYAFTATVTNDVSSTANITEFRIYNYTLATSNPNEFLAFNCLPETGWDVIPWQTSGDPYCLYSAETPADEIRPGQPVTFDFTATSPVTDSCRSWRFDTRAGDQTWYPPTYPVCIDAQAPITTKTFEGPQKVGEYGAEWIDGVTKVILHPTDPEPHPSDVRVTYWRNTLAISDDGSNDISPCYQPTNPFYCHSGPAPQDPFNPGDEWQVWNGSHIDKGEESCHIFDYYSIDNMGNVENIITNCFFVDKSPPILTKDNGQAIPGEDPEYPIYGTFHYISPDMPITFTCTDTYPHPSGDEKLCFKVSFDKPEYPTDVTSLYASKYGVSVGQDGFACVPVDPSAKNFIFNFNENEDSTHDLEYYCKDAVEKKSTTELQWYKVDDEPPQIIKTVGQPQVGNCTQGSQGPCYIQDHVTPITIDVVDAGEHKSGVNYCEWYYTVNGDPVGRGSNDTFPFDIIFPEDSTHVLNVTCYDNLGNEASDEETFLVDSIPPETTKTYGEPFFKEWREIECDDGLNVQGVSPQWCSSWTEWINSSTPVYLNVTDNKVGVDKVYWRNMVIENPEGWRVCERADWYCNPESYNQYIDSNTSWNVADGNTSFYKAEESCHVIEYYSVDKLGNTEPKKWQCPFVDNTPPVTNKTIGEPKVEVCAEANGDNVSSNEPFSPQNVGDEISTITFPEGGGIGVGVAFDGEFLYYTYIGSTNLYKIRPDGTGHAIIPTTGISESGLGALSYDATRGKIWAGTYGCDENDDGPVYLIDTDTGEATYMFSVPSTYISYCLDDGIAYDAKDDSVWYSDDVADEMVHMDTDGTLLGTVDVCAIDSRLCNKNSGIAIGGENFYLGTDGNEVTLRVDRDSLALLDEFVNTDFRIEDMECDPDTYSPTEVMWIRDAYAGQARAYEIEPNTCGLGGKPPEPACNQTMTTYITSQTPITLSCEDGQPHPVDHVSLFYRYRVSDDCTSWNDDNWTQWMDPNGDVVIKDIYLPQDSCHQVEYYCVDALGNKEPTKTETDIVDNQPPVITKTVVGPQVGNCPPQNEGDICMIDGVTTIHVEAEDPQPHPVNDVTCEWSYYVNDDSGASGGQQEVTPPFDINFPEESEHELYISCRDALGNPVRDVETFFVDKTPPVTTKTYGEPFYSNDTSEWISSSTPINLTVDDAGPHKSGVNATYYSVNLVDDENCRNVSLCQQAIVDDKASPKLYDNAFTIPEESCHLIEYYSVDNVNKTEPAKRQCVFVDNTPPTPVKTVGEPKEIWDGKNAEFYNLTEFCQTPGNCWNVTTMTPITLDCSDPEPHPVDNSFVHFRVELDGDLDTQKYCGEFGGTVDQDGYCHVSEQNAPITIKFNETSEHNLAFYCQDALGNRGPVDDEKFKVRESEFNITINKKWNLISVPFVLQGDSVHQIFDSHNDTIKSVWTYDAATGQWYVFTPDGEENDNLDRMIPGWGYWVLAKGNTSLLIGGGLFSPAILMPGKDVVSGWNLIGYYGLEIDEPPQTPIYPPAYDGPDHAGREARCELGSLVNTVGGHRTWTSLWSYWEPYNPNQWIPFNTTIRMDPGAGYWIMMNADGSYVPSTTCASS